MTGAEVVVATLERLGVPRVLGIPGVQNLELFDALAGASFPTIQVTHEQSAAFMADALGRLTGRPGVLAVVPGPGATNLATGLGEALLDSSPVLALVTTTRGDLPYKFQLHQFDQTSLLTPVAKKVITVREAGDLARAVWEGWHLATDGEPGPVVVELPFNLLMGPARMPQLLAPEPPPPLPKRKVEKICELLRAAERPGIYAGAGAFAASADLIALAEHLCAPIATTISGRGVVPEDHFLSVGFGFGGSGTALAQKVFADCDLLLAVGCKFGEVATGSYGFSIPKTFVHVDANPRVIGANYPPTVGLAADAGEALRAILGGLGGLHRADVCRLIDGLTRDKSVYFDAIQKRSDDPDHVSPRKLLVRLRAKLDRDAIVTTDSGNHAFYVLSDFSAFLPRTVLTPTDYNAMGFAVPAAVAAALEYPDRQVVAVVGDGGLLMTGVELLTARRAGRKVIVLCFHDGALGLIKLMQKTLYRRAAAVDLPALDLEAFARFVGADYVPLGSDLEIDAGLARALAATKSVIVDARVKYDAPTRYFKAVALANAKRMPVAQTLRIGARILRRAVLPGKDL